MLKNLFAPWLQYAVARCFLFGKAHYMKFGRPNSATCHEANAWLYYLEIVFYCKVHPLKFSNVSLTREGVICCYWCSAVTPFSSSSSPPPPPPPPPPQLPPPPPPSGGTHKTTFHIPRNPNLWNRKQNDDAFSSPRRLLQYCRMPNKNSRSISRYIWNLSRYLQVCIYLFDFTTSRATFKDVVRNPGW